MPKIASYEAPPKSISLTGEQNYTVRIRRSRSLSISLEPAKIPLDRSLVSPKIEKLLEKSFGPAHLPRAKPKKSAIQASELDPRDLKSVVVNPKRVIFVAYNLGHVHTERLREQLKPDFAEIQQAIQKGTDYKWMISANGSISIGPAVIESENFQKIKLGHPTLIGGLENPQGRIGGVLFYRSGENGFDGHFYIDNDSGRYSEYADRTKAHLENVGKRLKELGWPVQMQWKNMAAKKSSA